MSQKAVAHLAMCLCQLLLETAITRFRASLSKRTGESLSLVLVVVMVINILSVLVMVRKTVLVMVGNTLLMVVGKTALVI